MDIIIINGPNLNLLGKREPDIYGHKTFEQYFDELKALFPEVNLHYYQSNIEGELINKLHEVGFSYDGIIVNLAGYTHTSIALADAISAIKTPVVEVHISNIHAREAFRHVTYTGAKSVGIISGLGLRGYEMAIRYFT
jgi:3-dehydroquinate dehydratase II